MQGARAKRGFLFRAVVGLLASTTPQYELWSRSRLKSAGNSQHNPEQAFTLEGGIHANNLFSLLVQWHSFHRAILGAGLRKIISIGSNKPLGLPVTGLGIADLGSNKRYLCTSGYIFANNTLGSLWPVHLVLLNLDTPKTLGGTNVWADQGERRDCCEVHNDKNKRNNVGNARVYLHLCHVHHPPNATPTPARTRGHTHARTHGHVGTRRHTTRSRGHTTRTRHVQVGTRHAHVGTRKRARTQRESQQKPTHLEYFHYYLRCHVPHQKWSIFQYWSRGSGI